MALTWRAGALAALGAVFVGVVLPSWTGIAIVAAVILLGILIDLALAGPVRSLQFTRSGDTTVRLGATARVQTVITNPARRRVRALIRDAWPPSADAAPVQPRHSVTIPAGERRRIESVLTPTRRGDRHAEHVTVRSFGPLGLAARQRTMRSAWRLRVLPPFVSRRHLPSRLARLRELAGRTSLLVRGQGTEFDSLRDYTASDDVRSIDWRATPRRD